MPRTLAVSCSSTCPPNSSGEIGSATCTCTDPYVPDPAGTSCVLEQYTLELKTDPADKVAPSGQATVTATVKDAQGHGKSGVAVSIKVDVEAGSGGHDHDAGRHVSPYKGTLSAVSRTTVADGTTSFTFTAPEVSGTHTFTAKCDSPACTNNPVTAKIDVKVDGLAPITPSGLYALYEPDGSVVGATKGRHPSNHYLTTTAANKLIVIAINYHHRNPQAPVLHINDASLMWGGVFDIDAEADWNTPHKEHRRGTVVDIRANSTIGAIPPANFDAFIQLAQDRGVDARVHNSGKTNQHFHVRLLDRSE